MQLLFDRRPPITINARKRCRKVLLPEGSSGISG
jgi:hypothetical protein